MKNIMGELEKLRLEQEKFNVYAAYDGVIGSVAIKPGDIIAPHMPILSVDSHAPSYVNGFIHENSYQEISVNDRIEVASDWNRNKKAVGEVVGIGSKITEYPERLRKNIEVRLWGREVQIKIPEDNLFLQGEKVTLRKMN
jgi:HlyD family secretion protein